MGEHYTTYNPGYYSTTVAPRYFAGPTLLLLLHSLQMIFTLEQYYTGNCGKDWLDGAERAQLEMY